MTNMVQGHRKIGSPISQRPFSDLFLRDTVDDGDAVRIRHVDEDLACIGVDLETFGMRLQGNVADFAASRRIDNGQRSAAISDEHSFGGGIKRILSASPPSSICPAAL